MVPFLSKWRYCGCGKNSGHHSGSKKSQFGPFLSFLLLALPFLMLTATVMLLGFPRLSISNNDETTVLTVINWEGISDRQFILGILKDPKICQRYYEKSDSEFVWWWLHLEKDDINKGAFEKQWLTRSNHTSKNTARRQHFLNSLRHRALNYYFRPRLSKSDRQLMMNVTRMCLAVVEKLHLPYFVFSGTLVGYVRHNASIIPWDDDFDVSLPVHRPDEIPEIMASLQRTALSMFSGAIRMYAMPKHLKMKRIKCHSTLLPPIQGYEWGWPFVDFQFMRYRRSGLFHVEKFIQNMDIIYENVLLRNSHPTYVALGLTQFGRSFMKAKIYPYDQVFPVKRVNFGEESVPLYIPRNPVKTLAVNFGNLSKCQSPSYSHRMERPYNRMVEVDCSELSSLIENYYHPKTTVNYYD